MKTLIALGVAGALVALKVATGFPCCVLAPSSEGEARLSSCEEAVSCQTDAVVGQYVEARTAAVYAGACHFSGEYVTAGSEAILAWRVDAGAHAGVDLSGHAAVALVCGDVNLAEAGARRSILYLPADAPEELAGWLRDEHAQVLGEVVRVERAEVSFERSGEDFDVRVGEDLAVAGSTMPNRECCKMDYNVWYDPFVAVEGRIAGCVDDFSCRTDALGKTWSVADENCAFVGAF